jgi:hypothetical protein
LTGTFSPTRATEGAAVMSTVGQSSNPALMRTEPSEISTCMLASGVFAGA